MYKYITVLAKATIIQARKKGNEVNIIVFFLPK